MKNKIIASIVIAIFMMLMLSNLYAVMAVEELDSNNYIIFPSIINIQNGIATGTIKLAEEVEGYNISYQKKDITSETKKKIDAKSEESQKYVENAEAQLQQKEDNIEKLEQEIQQLQATEPVDEDAIEQAQETYDIACNDYEEYYQEVEKQIDQFDSEYKALIPQYTNDWTSTEDKENNIQMDFSKYTGQIHFVLWVKITNSTNTYYDCNLYSTDITAKSEENPSATKIKVEPTSDVKKYKFTVSDITPEEGHAYFYYIGDGNTEPTFSTNWNQLSYDEENKVLYSAGISEYLELSAKQYVYIYDYYLDANSKNVSEKILDKTELPKPEQKKYTDVFYATGISKISDSADCYTQILFNTPWGENTVRKVHIKIGKISDDTILQSIQNKKGTAFEDLLQYAKKNNGFYDNTLNSNATGTAGGIEIRDKNPLFDVKNIVDGEYYFLYAVVEAENGKYVQTEGVTLARANKTDSSNTAFSLFFYGSDKFSWKTFTGGEGEEVEHSKITKLPYAGNSIIMIMAISVISGVGFVTYKKYQKYKGI